MALGMLALFLPAGIAEATEPLRVQVQLIWGTNDPQSPNPKHKEIDVHLAKKLSKSPYRWKNYFEVNRQIESIPVTQTRKNIKMSEHCTLDIKNLGDGRVEVTLHGDGKPVSRHVEPLQNDWPLILAGNAKNDTAWLVVIKKADAPPEKALDTKAQ
jgi:hypothetical protein